MKPKAFFVLEIVVASFFVFMILSFQQAQYDKSKLSMTKS